MKEKRHGGFFWEKAKEYNHLSNLGRDGSNI
jgi:hypothetical protein